MAFTRHEIDYIHWRMMGLALPLAGVDARFPSEESCRERFIAMRWPEGPRCARCSAAQPTWISSRSLFQCAECRYQFSVTSGTALHRSRIGLKTWFLATEEIIRFRVAAGYNLHVAAQSLAETIGVQYVAAYRAKKIVLEDIRPGGEGLLSSMVCVEQVELPVGVARNSEEHYLWLLGRQDPLLS